MPGRWKLSLYLLLLMGVSYGQEQPDRVDSMFMEYRLFLLEDSPYGIPRITDDSSMVELYPIHRYNDYRPELFISTYSGPSIDLTQPYVRNNGIAETLIRSTSQRQAYYLTPQPVTTLSLRVGTATEQNFELFHSQNIMRIWNVSVGFNRVNHIGFYDNQDILNDRLWLTSSFVDPKGRYQAFVSGNYWNRRMGQNGGIVSDSTFKENLLEDKGLIDVQSNEGNSQLRNWDIKFCQYLNVGVVKDSAGNFVDLKSGRFEHAFQWKRGKRTFHDSDPTQDLYPQILYDSIQTSDSVARRMIRNEFGWRGFQGEKFSYYIGSGHEWHRYAIKPSTDIERYDTSLSSYYVGMSALFQTGSLSLKGSAEYVMVGLNEQGYVADFQIQKDSLSFLLNRFRVNAGVKRSLWDLTYYTYTSNHYDWDLTWEQTTEAFVKANLFSTDKPYGVNLIYRVFDGYYFYDQTARPVRYSGADDVLTVSARASLSFGNFEFTPEIWYHSLSSNVLSVPEWVMEGELIWKRPLFKGKLQSRFGVNVMWFSSYTGWAYSPVLGQFYLQAEREIGNYPYIDFFVDAKVKEVRFFVKVSHLNSGFMGDGYFGALHYPMPDRAVQLGITWPFLN